MDKIIFLGTSAGMPTLKRNVPALAMVFKPGDEFWLFDCGEGTQRQILQSNLKLSRLSNIFISHLHGDHTFGLPGLLATRGLLGVKKSVNIFGPVGLDSYLNNNMDYTRTHIPYSQHLFPIEKERFLAPNLLWEKENISVYCAALNHNIDSFGFAIIKKHIQKNILIDKLLDINIPPGPIYKKFKEDETVELEDGRILKSSDFVKETITIKKVCYCGDTTFSKNAVFLSEGADLLIHEATFSTHCKEKAIRSFHSTVGDAIEVARLAKVKKLALTHISPRYDDLANSPEKYTEFRELDEKISSDSPEIILAEDLMELEI